jgi:hypothetical protein
MAEHYEHKLPDGTTWTFEISETEFKNTYHDVQFDTMKNAFGSDCLRARWNGKTFKEEAESELCSLLFTHANQIPKREQLDELYFEVFWKFYRIFNLFEDEIDYYSIEEVERLEKLSENFTINYEQCLENPQEYPELTEACQTVLQHHKKIREKEEFTKQFDNFYELNYDNKDD